MVDGCAGAAAGAFAAAVGFGGSTSSRGSLRGGTTTTPTRSSRVNCTYGSTRTVLVSCPGVAWTSTTRPMGTPGTNGRPLREPKETTRSPVLTWALPLSSCTFIGAVPWPAAKPISSLPSIRVPAVKPGSEASSTVAVVGATVVTRPTMPWPLMTVMSRVRPSSLPASMVIVQEKPWAAPNAMTWAALMV